jgi:YjbE family integral membrane protein
MSDLLTPEAVTALLQVVFIDLVLAGDNAIVIGLAVAGLPQHQRARAILLGIGAATLLRIIFAAMATQLLEIIGLLLAGGLLLLWVSWKMWRELRIQEPAHATSPAVPFDADPGRKGFRQAATQIVLADVSMSLDNVLAVAGAARHHPEILVFGLMLSVALMGIGANYIARLLQQHRWIAYVGLAVILYVALDMTYRGGLEVWPMARALAQDLVLMTFAASSG